MNTMLLYNVCNPNYTNGKYVFPRKYYLAVSTLNIIYILIWLLWTIWTINIPNESWMYQTIRIYFKNYKYCAVLNTLYTTIYLELPTTTAYILPSINSYYF